MSGTLDVLIILALIIFLAVIIYLALFHSPKVPDLTAPPASYQNGQAICVYTADCGANQYCPAISPASSLKTANCGLYCGGANTTFCSKALSPSAQCVLQPDGVSSFCQLQVCGTQGSGCGEGEQCVPYNNGTTTVSYCYPVPEAGSLTTSNCSSSTQNCFGNPNIPCQLTTVNNGGQQTSIYACVVNASS